MPCSFVCYPGSAGKGARNVGSCRRQGARFHPSESGSRGRHAQRSAEEGAGGPGVHAGGVQRHLHHRDVHVSRLGGRTEQGQRHCARHHGRHVLRAQGVGRRAVVEVSASERLQQGRDSSVRCGQPRHDRAEGHLEARDVRHRPRRRRSSRRSARRRTQRAELREGEADARELCETNASTPDLQLPSPKSHSRALGPGS